MSAVSPDAGTGFPELPPPPRRRRPLRTVLVVVAIVLGLLLLALVGSVALQETESGRFTVDEPVDEVRLDLRVGQVEVMAGDADQVEVAYTRHFAWKAPELDTSATDGVLTLGGGCGSSFMSLVCSVDYQVRVPPGTQVTGSTTAGDVTLEGLDGEVDVATSAGDLEALDVSGPLRLRSSAGDVTVLDTASPRIAVRTSAGDVEVAAVEPPDELVAETSAGDVDIVVPDVAYDVIADTSAGDLAVEVVDDPSAPRTISARTSAGDVTIVAR